MMYYMWLIMQLSVSVDPTKSEARPEVKPTFDQLFGIIYSITPQQMSVVHDIIMDRG